MQDIECPILAMRSGFLAIVCAMQDIENPIPAMRSGFWQLCVLCRFLGSWLMNFLLAARVLLYAPSHRQDSTHHGLCYTIRGALALRRNS